MSPAAEIRRGLPERMRGQAGDLLEEAFGEKNRVVIPDAGKRVAFLRRTIDAAHVLVAGDGDELLGLAGLASRDAPYAGGLLDLGWDPRPHVDLLGWVGAAWAVWGMRLAEHRPAADELYLDGLAVVPWARGQGIGTRLLAEVVDIARGHGKRVVRLDVVDTNHRARAFYERLGFHLVSGDGLLSQPRHPRFGAILRMERPTLDGPGSDELRRPPRSGADAAPGR
jgi:ribosomal protein S18 acetylase RimI-like enzyme